MDHGHEERMVLARVQRELDGAAWYGDWIPDWPIPCPERARTAEDAGEAAWPRLAPAWLDDAPAADAQVRP